MNNEVKIAKLELSADGYEKDNASLQIEKHST